MRRWYFTVVSGLMLALTIIGFSDNLFTDVGQPSNVDPKFIAHGLFCLAWMILLVVQANLVRLRNVRLHRRLGVAAVVIAIGVTLSTLYVFAAGWPGWSALDAEAKANRLLLPSYSVLVAWAFLARRKPDLHRHLILVATFYMLDPGARAGL